jgi:hypothetical protein
MDYLTFTGPASYPTGGVAAFAAYVAAAVARGQLTVLAAVNCDCGGYMAVYDVAADKLKIYQSAGVAAADAPVTAAVAAVPAIPAAPLAEVASTTNLSAVTFKVLVLSI